MKLKPDVVLSVLHSIKRSFCDHHHFGQETRRSSTVPDLRSPLNMAACAIFTSATVNLNRAPADTNEVNAQHDTQCCSLSVMEKCFTLDQDCRKRKRRDFEWSCATDSDHHWSSAGSCVCANSDRVTSAFRSMVKTSDKRFNNCGQKYSVFSYCDAGM